MPYLNFSSHTHEAKRYRSATAQHHFETMDHIIFVAGLVGSWSMLEIPGCCWERSLANMGKQRNPNIDILHARLFQPYFGVIKAIYVWAGVARNV